MLAGEIESVPAALTELPSTGALRGERPRALEAWIDAVCGAGLVRVSDDQYRTLSLTASGRDVMDGRASSVRLAPPSAPPARSRRREPPTRRTAALPDLSSGPGGVPAAGVSEALRAWRIEQARRRGVPPYVILHDRTLDAIASSLPQSLQDLERLPGIGPAKLKAHGDAILSLVASARSRTEPGRRLAKRSVS